MKKEQAKKQTGKKKAADTGNTAKKGGSEKLKKQETGILDFDLEEVAPKKESKSAAEPYGGKMPQKPVTVGTDTLELLDVEELLQNGGENAARTDSTVQADKTVPADKTMSAAAKEEVPPVKAGSKKKPKKDESFLDFEPKRMTGAGAVSQGQKKKQPAGKKKREDTGKKKESWLSEFNAMDAVIALTGVVVLFVAVFAVGIFTSARAVEGQVAAMAEVGEKMEAIGIAGDGILTAVADARIAGLEAAEPETQVGETESDGYVEKELTVEMQIGLKLTSVQRDLKIKFTNKSSGKLIGNQPFAVQIQGPEKLTKTDDDKDGIIYIKSITPGEYTVSITGPEEIDGNRAAGISGMVTVKDQIEYKKIDVADEVKSESEINAAKEDTEVKTQSEALSADTVEWVESSKTPIEGGEITYEEVKKADIPEPSLKASLDRILALPGTEGVWFSQDSTVSQPAGTALFSATSSATVESVSLDGPDSAKVGESVKVTLTVTMSDGSGYDGNVNWKNEGGDLSTNGMEATVSSKSAGLVKVTAEVGGQTSTLAITFTASQEESKEESREESKEESAPSEPEKESESETETGSQTETESQTESGTESTPAEEELEIELEDPGTMKVGQEKTLQYKVVKGKASSTEWSVSDSKIVSIIDKKSGKVKALAEGTVKVTVTVTDGKDRMASASGSLKVEKADVDGIQLDPASLTLKPGEKQTVKATVSTGGNPAVDWKTSDENVVKLSEKKENSCVAEGVKPGKATITAVSRENADKTAACEVTVGLEDGSAPLKDKDGNQLYYKKDGQYKEATAADYYQYDVFYRKKDTGKYLYTGWQNLDGKRYYFDKNGVPVTGEQIIQGMKYTFNADGSLQSNGLLGIDVSKHNGKIDWNAVKNAGVNFVIIRCGYRGSATGVLVEDQRFKTNIQGAAAAGLKVGIYFFSQAVNEVEAVEEASMTLDLIRKYSISYPVYMDVESANGRADGLDSATRTKVIRAFCETVRNGGYTAGVYANKTWLNEKMNVGSLGSYKIWLAQYATTPTHNGRYEMWQYSSKGRIAGIPELVDLNLSYMSY